MFTRGLFRPYPLPTLPPKIGGWRQSALNDFATIKVWSGSAWVERPFLKFYDGAQWVTPRGFWFDGLFWRPINIQTRPDIPSTVTVWARYKASDMIAVGNGNTLSQWDDRTGNGRHAVQATSARRPILRTAASGLSGLNTVAIEFLGDDTNPHNMGLPSMAGLTQGAIFAFLKNDVDGNGVVGNIRRIWEMGSATDGYYKYTAGGIEGIYETFGTTVRKTTGQTSPASGVLTNWHGYSVASASGAFTNWINNVQHFNTGTNTVGFSASPIIGGYPAGTSTTRLANKLYTEIIILSVVPTALERAGFQQYFWDEYM